MPCFLSTVKYLTNMSFQRIEVVHTQQQLSQGAALSPFLFAV